MEILNKKYISFNSNLIILGFGAIGQAVLPLIFRHINIVPKQVIIISNKDSGLPIANEYGVDFKICEVTSANYKSILNEVLSEHDFLLNVAVDVSSRDLIQFCHEKNALYLDTSFETWKEYMEETKSSAEKTIYTLREQVLSLKKSGPTAVLTHGANPGLISHFVKQALYNLANDYELEWSTADNQSDWANLAKNLNVKTIQVAEFDSQVSSLVKKNNEFVNSWSVEGLIIESIQPAEIGWGTHERHWPDDGKKHEAGSQCAIYLDKPSATCRVQTWTPLAGAFQGYLITHAESITLAHYLSIKKGSETVYRPTVHYAYSPCSDAIQSLRELEDRNWLRQSEQRLLMHDITHGMDELGVLVLGHPKGAYWFGSQLTIGEARALAPHNSATTLQVAAGVLAGIIWAMNNPSRGIVEPEMMDYASILEIARPYLGIMNGYYSDWNPIKGRVDDIDKTDPWQFKNILI